MMDLATMQPFSMWGWLFGNALSPEGSEKSKIRKPSGVQSPGPRVCLFPVNRGLVI